MTDYADRALTAQKIFELLELTSQITAASGRSIDTLIRDTVEELGEYCTAISVEVGDKHKELKESSKIEAVDLVICALALFYGVGGNQEEFAEILGRNLFKWKQEGGQNE